MHYCHWFRLTLRTQEIKRRQSNQRGVWVREIGGNLLSQIAKMVDRLFADRVVLPVFAAIYRNAEEKPAMCWAFKMGIGGEIEKALFDLIVRVREGFRIAYRCSQLSTGARNEQIKQKKKKKKKKKLWGIFLGSL